MIRLIDDLDEVEDVHGLILFGFPLVGIYYQTYRSYADDTPGTRWGVCILGVLIGKVA